MMGNWKIDENIVDNNAIYHLFRKYNDNEIEPFIDYNNENLATIRPNVLRECKSIKSFYAPSVTCIAESAFQNSSIQEYDLKNTVKVMNYAFYNCTNYHGDTLNRISFDANYQTKIEIDIYAFNGCNKILGLYANYINIGNHAFGLSSPKNGLENIYINKCDIIGNHAFLNQSNLQNILLLNDTIEYYQSSIINYVNDYAFSGCQNLSTIQVNNIGHVGNFAFDECKLSTVNVSCINNVNMNGFNGCTELQQLHDITLKTVDEDGFYKCENFTDITNAKLNTIKSNAFRLCSLTNLTNVKLENIWSKAFDSLPLQKVIIDKITTITNSNIFNHCTQLNYIQINEGTINTAPFQNIGNTELTVNLTNQTCIPIEVGTFKDSIKYLYANSYTGSFPEHMFENNLNLTEANIRNTTKVSNYMFSNCTQLSRCPCQNIIGDYAFNNCSLSSGNDFYNITTIGNYGIYNGMIDKSSATMTWSTLQQVGNFAFGKINYHIMNFPVLTTIYSNTFKEFTGNGLHLDILSTTPTNMCNNLTQLKELYINNVKTINEYTCNNCYNLITVNCNSGTSTLQSLLMDINNYAFSNCQKLTTFITNIRTVNVGHYAFNGCIALTTFNGTVNFITGTSNQFRNCKALTSIKLLNTVTSIPNYCFYLANTLKTIGTEDNIANLYNITQVGNFSFFNGGIVDLRFDTTKEVSIGSDSFNGCPITSITWPKIAKLGTYVFMKTALPSVDVTNVRTSTNAMYIPSHTFRECKSLTTVTGLNHTINSYAFSQCTALTNIQGQITDIAGYAFNGCTALETFDCSVTGTISENAFKNCTSLTTLKNINNIGPNAFKNFSKLTTIENIKNIGYGGFDGCINLTYNDSHNYEALNVAADYGFNGCAKLKFNDTYKYLDSNIGNYTFNGCCNLVNLHFSSTVLEIGEYGFGHCTNLSTINTWSNSNLTINNYAFTECTNFTGFAWKNDKPSLVNIGSNAFDGCSKLKYFFSDIAVNINEYAFNGCRNLSTDSSVIFNIIETSNSLSNYYFTIPTHSFTNCSVNFVVNSGGQHSSRIYTIKSEAFTDNDNVSLRRNTVSTYTSLYYNIEEFAFKNTTNVSLLAKFSSIAQNAFNGCQNVIIDSEGSSAGRYLSLTTNSFNNAGNVTINGDIHSIGTDTFYNCKKVTLYLTNSSMKTFTSGLLNIDIEDSSNSYKRVYLYLPNDTMRNTYRNSSVWKTYFNNTQSTTNSHINTLT